MWANQQSAPVIIGWFNHINRIDDSSTTPAPRTRGNHVAGLQNAQEYRDLKKINRITTTLDILTCN